MDPFRRTFLSDEDAVDYCESEEEGSDEDDINEIEEALLQSIHYAEDYQEDLSPGEEDETKSPRQLMSNESFPHIKFTSVKRDKVELENTFQIQVPITGDVENSDKTGVQSKGLDVTVKLEVNKSLEEDRNAKTALKIKNKLSKAATRVTEENYVSAISIDSDSDQDSKYKSFPKSSLKSKISCDAENSVIEISSDNEERRLQRLSSTRIKEEVEVISISSSDSDVESVLSEELDDVQKEAIASDEPKLSSIRRKWSKPAAVSGDGRTLTTLSQDVPAKKVKLKRSDVAELRQILDVIKELNSDDDLSSEGAMVIESVSEDEALDVHFINLGMGRYYQNEGNPFCYKCKQSGHKTQDCTNRNKTRFMTCILCGTKGHNDRQCSERQCFACQEVGHQIKDCTNKKYRYITCNRCSMTGHKAKYCPDRWRQYHMTTEPGNIIQYNGTIEDQSVSVNGKVYCYNCSLEGHFGHECMEEPMDRYAPLILPYVVKYDYIPKRFWNVQMERGPHLADSMSTGSPQNEEESMSTVDPQNQDSMLTVNPQYNDYMSTVNPQYGDSMPTVNPQYEDSMSTVNPQYGDSMSTVNPHLGDKADFRLHQSRSRQGKKARHKRKQTDGELQYIKPKKKKKRLKTNEEKEQDKKLAKLMKQERRRIKKQQHQESLENEPTFEEYEKANSYIIKGGHVLRKRDKLARQQYVVEEQPVEIKKKIVPAKTKKKMEKKNENKKRKKLKRKQENANFQELKRQYEEQKQQDIQQQVTFRPSQELFEMELFGREDQNFDSQKDLGQSEGTQSVKGKKFRMRKRRRQVQAAEAAEQAASSKKLTNRQKRKEKKQQKIANDQLYHKKLQQAYQEHAQWKRQQKAVGQRFMSDKGFRVEPKY
ncbi:uncharacterized protein [Asterias amurensis]